MIPVQVGNICVRVMQLMSAAKVSEGNHTRQESDAAPPEVCVPRAAEMAVNALVRHHRAEENQIRAEQDVHCELKVVDDGDKKRSHCEHANDTDDAAVEVENMWPVGDHKW